MKPRTYILTASSPAALAAPADAGKFSLFQPPPADPTPGAAVRFGLVKVLLPP